MIGNTTQGAQAEMIVSTRLFFNKKKTILLELAEIFLSLMCVYRFFSAFRAENISGLYENTKENALF